LDIEFLGIKKLQLPETVTHPCFERMTSERKSAGGQIAI